MGRLADRSFPVDNVNHDTTSPHNNTQQSRKKRPIKTNNKDKPKKLESKT